MNLFGITSYLVVLLVLEPIKELCSGSGLNEKEGQRKKEKQKVFY